MITVNNWRHSNWPKQFLLALNKKIALNKNLHFIAQRLVFFFLVFSLLLDLLHFIDNCIFFKVVIVYKGEDIFICM